MRIKYNIYNNFFFSIIQDKDIEKNIFPIFYFFIVLCTHKNTKSVVYQESLEIACFVYINFYRHNINFMYEKPHCES